MELTEFQLFIPLLIYGIALSRLIAEWKRFFDGANWHWPFVITVLVLTEVSVWNIYIFLDIFTQRPVGSYFEYLGLLGAPFTMLLATEALFGHDDDGIIDQEEFRSRTRLGYGLIACYWALHLLPRYRADDGEWVVRLPALLLAVAIAWFRREWLIYGLGVVWLLSCFRRLQLGL